MSRPVAVLRVSIVFSARAHINRKTDKKRVRDAQSVWRSGACAHRSGHLSVRPSGVRLSLSLDRIVRSIIVVYKIRVRLLYIVHTRPGGKYITAAEARLSPYRSQTHPVYIHAYN